MLRTPRRKEDEHHPLARGGLGLSGTLIYRRLSSYASALQCGTKDVQIAAAKACCEAKGLILIEVVQS